MRFGGKCKGYVLGCRKFERLGEVSESLQQLKHKLLEELGRVTQENAESIKKYKTALKTQQEIHEAYVYFSLVSVVLFFKLYCISCLVPIINCLPLG